MRKFNLEEEVFVIFNPRDLIDYEEDGNILSGDVIEVKTVTTTTCFDTTYKHSYDVSFGFDSSIMSEDKMFRTREEAKEGAIALCDTEIQKVEALLARLKACKINLI